MKANLENCFWLDGRELYPNIAFEASTQNAVNNVLFLFVVSFDAHKETLNSE